MRPMMVLTATIKTTWMMMTTSVMVPSQMATIVCTTANMIATVMVTMMTTMMVMATMMATIMV